MANVQALPLAKDHIPDFEVKTPIQSAARLWHKLRKGQVAATEVIPIAPKPKFQTFQTQAMKLRIASEPLAAVKYSSQ